MDVSQSYDSAARVYAEHLGAELDHKPLDRHLLNRFAEEVRGRGLVADLGCGPGQVAGYLHERGVAVIGFDLSPGMVTEAGRLHPEIDFRVGDIRNLDLPDAGIIGAVGFYSIVHFAPEELVGVFTEIRRAVALGGFLLLAFHIGDAVVRVEDLFGAPVVLDFRFHLPAQVGEALRLAKFNVIESVEREPYAGAEYPSRRCYLLAVAV